MRSGGAIGDSRPRSSTPTTSKRCRPGRSSAAAARIWKPVFTTAASLKTRATSGREPPYETASRTNGFPSINKQTPARGWWIGASVAQPCTTRVALRSIAVAGVTTTPFGSVCTTSTDPCATSRAALSAWAHENGWPGSTTVTVAGANGRGIRARDDPATSATASAAPAAYTFARLVYRAAALLTPTYATPGPQETEQNHQDERPLHDALCVTRYTVPADRGGALLDLAAIALDAGKRVVGRVLARRAMAGRLPGARVAGSILAISVRSRCRCSAAPRTLRPCICRAPDHNFWRIGRSRNSIRAPKRGRAKPGCRSSTTRC